MAIPFRLAPVDLRSAETVELAASALLGPDFELGNKNETELELALVDGAGERREQNKLKGSTPNCGVRAANQLEQRTKRESGLSSVMVNSRICELD
jgi:hypothetical protein